MRPEGPKVAMHGLDPTLMLVVGEGRMRRACARSVHAPATDNRWASATARIAAWPGGSPGERALVGHPAPVEASKRRPVAGPATRLARIHTYTVRRSPVLNGIRMRSPFPLCLLTVTVGNVNRQVPHTSPESVQSGTRHDSPTIGVSSALGLSMEAFKRDSKQPTAGHRGARRKTLAARSTPRPRRSAGV
jgi:hypothetical protein